MPSDADALVEMGFARNRVEKAMAVTKNAGLQAAMDWLLSHADDTDIDDPIDAEDNSLSVNVQPTSAEGSSGGLDVSSATGPGETQANSIKCDECGKQFRCTADAELHAARTQHVNFSQSTDVVKPLTEEEKKAQLERLQQKIAEKRKEREEKEKLDQLEREKLRRNTGKSITQIKLEHDQKEMKQLAEDRRREKLADKAAKQKILEQIQKDKEARAAKFGSHADSALSSSSTDQEYSQNTISPMTVPATIATQAAPKKDYTECRLQIRLPKGDSLIQTFGIGEPLASVRLFVQMNNVEVGDFTFMTTFPRKVFTDEDMEKPLSVLGLVPSAVLMVTKK